VNSTYIKIHGATIKIKIGIKYTDNKYAHIILRRKAVYVKLKS